MARKRKKQREVEDSGFGDTFDGLSEAPAEASPARGRLTPVDVQEKVFRLAFRGYREGDVDEFLDKVTEELATLHEENKRLREQLAEGGVGAGVATAASGEARQQAETIVRQAREHAARLIEEAQRRSASMGAAQGPPPPGSYLMRERQFLQRLAGLVQEHTRSLKEEAKRGRNDRPPEGEGGAAEPGSREEPAAPAAPPPPPPESSRSESAPEPPRTGGPQEAYRPPGPTASPPETARPDQPDRGPEARAERKPSSAAEPGVRVEDRPADGDPLLQAWERAFMDPESEAASSPSAPPLEGEPGDEEPSLRELFWGEE